MADRASRADAVAGIVFASAALLCRPPSEQIQQQVANVATLPGIVETFYTMPDVHLGYGFAIGGVAATDLERGGVVSPGGVGSTSPVADTHWSHG